MLFSSTLQALLYAPNTDIIMNEELIYRSFICYIKANILFVGLISRICVVSSRLTYLSLKHLDDHHQINHMTHYKIPDSL